MAIVTDYFVSGTLGNVVFYKRLGRNCARVKRTHIKQTLPTKIRGINFGIASRAGKALRSELQDVIPLPTDRSMQSRFSGAIARWLGVVPVDQLPPCEVAGYISTFQFTGGYSFNERFKVSVTIAQPGNNLIRVSLPAFVPLTQIMAPANTISIKLVIGVAACLLKSGVPNGSTSLSISIPYNNIEVPAQTLDFNIAASAGNLVVTAAALQYNVAGKNKIAKPGNDRWIPAGVLNARYS